MSFLTKIFKKKEKKKQDVSVHENLSGNYFYHIAVNDIPLCRRKDTMRRNIPLSGWGFVTHLNERYCKECEKKWIEGKFNE